MARVGLLILEIQLLSIGGGGDRWFNMLRF